MFGLFCWCEKQGREYFAYAKNSGRLYEGKHISKVDYNLPSIPEINVTNKKG